MKLIANALRVIVGLLFVFSGFIKINDPVGFSIKLEEYFKVFENDLEPEKDSLISEIQFSEEPSASVKITRLKNESEKLIKIKALPWEHIEIKDENGVSKSFYDKVTLKIWLEDEEIFYKDIEKKDAKPYEIIIKAKVNKNTLINKTITIYNNKDISEELKINLSQFIKQPGWLAKTIKALIPFTFSLALFICLLEIVLGICLLIGWKKNLTLWLIALMILFFTFLTWYSAHYNKVTDCGCFGNAIPLAPWQSFLKDLALCIFVSFIIVLRKYIKPVFSQKFSWKLVLVIALISLGYTFYCWYYLPVFNFLKFSVGNDIEKLITLPPDAKMERREMKFIYTKNGKDEEFNMEQLTSQKIAENPEYKFKDRIDRVIIKGDEPKIHDFVILDKEGNNHVDDFLKKNEYKLLMVSESLTQTRPKAMKKISKLAHEWTNSSKFEIWALTSSNPNEAEAIRHEYQLPFTFYFGDNTNIKSIIRSNPGLLLFKKGVVVAVWPSTDLPSYNELLRKIK